MKDDFISLNPHTLIQGLVEAGQNPTGRFIQLNSFENRVFDIFLENPDPGGGPETRVIAKYYRPGRWSLDSIRAEHDFLSELQGEGFEVAAPLKLKGGDSVIKYLEFPIAVFPKLKGRMCQELFLEDFELLGTRLAELHMIGQRKEADNRPELDCQNYGYDQLDALEEYLPPELVNQYFDASEFLLEELEERLKNITQLRIHGDCHRGNLLMQDDSTLGVRFSFIDFDDFCTGPAVQDIWMLLPNVDDLQSKELELLLKGYTRLRNISDYELQTIFHLRALRIISYSGWIALRWHDPAFHEFFPQFLDYSHWASELSQLESIANSI